MAQIIRNIEDIRSYKSVLEKKLSNGVADMEDNDDCVHNVVVNCVMLENCTDIRMYCGQMALFQNKFYNRIAKETNSEDCAREAKRMFGEALENFVNRKDSHLTIYVENPDEISSSNFLDTKLVNDALKRKSIHLYKVDGNLVFKAAMQHMIVGDKNKMVRWETNKENHSAKCFFHVDKTFENNADTLFNYLGNAASIISHV